MQGITEQTHASRGARAPFHGLERLRLLELDAYAELLKIEGAHPTWRASHSKRRCAPF